jgi:hypothetical protein
MTFQEENALRLDRFALDEIARKIVSGERNGNKKNEELADQIARLLSNRLSACGAPGFQKITRIPSRSPLRGRFDLPCSPELFRAILARVEKHLAHTVMTS